MKICPFCGKSFEYKDLLFFGEMKAGSANDVPDTPAPSIIPGVGGGGMFDMFSYTDAPETSPVAVEPEEEAVPVDEGIFGVWRDDDVYNEYIKRYHGSKDIRKSRFIVNWSADEACHGTAKVSKWLDPAGKNIPFAVNFAMKTGRNMQRTPGCAL